MDVAAACGALHLNPLAYEVQWKHTCFRDDAGEHAGGRVSGPPQQVHSAERESCALVHGEEDAHERHDLREAGSQAAEEAPYPLVAVDLPDSLAQRRVYALVTLGGEARAQQVQRIRGRGGRGTCDGAADEGFGGVREMVLLAGQAMQQHRRRPVCGELDRRVGDVHQLGGYVALP